MVEIKVDVGSGHALHVHLEEQHDNTTQRSHVYICSNGDFECTHIQSGTPTGWSIGGKHTLKPPSDQMKSLSRISSKKIWHNNAPINVLPFHIA